MPGKNQTPEQKRAYLRKWYALNKHKPALLERKRKQAKRYYDSNLEQCRTKAAARQKERMQTPEARQLDKEWRKSQRETGQAKSPLYSRMGRIRLKAEVILAMGGKCACCDETEQEFLTVDHVNENGNVHRRNVTLGGGWSWRVAKASGYSSDYQLLCFNCNLSKAYGKGVCSHSRSFDVDVLYSPRSKWTRAWHRRLKQQVVDGYGGRCACCKETCLEFLTIDHVHGNGNQHRKTVKALGKHLYQVLIAEGFPNYARVLCFNCNLSARNHDGVCVHQLAL